MLKTSFIDTSGCTTGNDTRLFGRRGPLDSFPWLLIRSLLPLVDSEKILLKITHLPVTYTMNMVSWTTTPFKFRRACLHMQGMQGNLHTRSREITVKVMAYIQNRRHT